MSFTRVNPLGWALFEELTSAQMNALDIDHANALDVVGGGAHVTSNPLTVGGAQWQFDNDVKFSQSGSGWIANTYPSLNTRSLHYQQPLAFFHNISDRFLLSVSFGFLAQIDTADAGGVFFACTNLPAFGTITAIQAWVTGSYLGPNAHAAGLPGIMPRLHAWQRDPNQALWTSLFDIADSSPDPASYDVYHAISQTGLSLPVQGDFVYYLRVAGESGAFSVADAFAISRLDVFVDVDQIGP